MKIYNKSIFIFRRDYRLHDNIGLIEALKKSTSVIPIFIFTPEQVTNNPYKSDNAVQFMIESLEELDEELKKKKSDLPSRKRKEFFQLGAFRRNF
jgi:deoxyribodipyrimidine photo-lyase